MNIFARGIDKRQRIEWIMDALSLGAVLQYCAYRFLQSTMFVIYYSQTYKLLTMVLLLVFGGVRYLYVLVKKWTWFVEKKEKVMFLLRCAGAWIIVLPFFYVGWRLDCKFLIFLPICCMCLYDMEASNVLKWFSITIGVLLIATTLCSLTGTVRNLVVPWGHVTGSFGVINSTDYASYFVFLLLVIWCRIDIRKWYKCVLYACIAGIIIYCVWWYTDSRTVLICGGLVVFAVLWEGIEEHVICKANKFYRISQKIDLISGFVFPVTAIILIILTAQYGADNSLAQRINNAFNGRLEGTWKPYQVYGIHAFGSLIDSMHGVGGTRIVEWSSGNTYIDVAYAMLAIRYGWVITAIVTGLWVWMTIRALRAGRRKIAFAMAILAIHAVSEARVLDINYNIFLAMPFCILRLEPKNKRDILTSNEVEKHFLFHFFTAIVLIILIFIKLAHVTSVLRTFFAIQKWNEGTASIYSLGVCIGLVLLLLTLWKTSVWIININNQKRVVFLICIFILFGAGVIMNYTINQEISAQSERLNAEERIIKSVQEVATQPVYVAENSEIYQRRFGGFDDHYFSSEELRRGYRGSIFTNSDIEVLGITELDGMYTQISEWSGIYSYDPAVIEKLTSYGYKWTPYYSGTRECNMKDLKILNGMNQKEPIVLSKSMRIITKNIEKEQFAGSYEVGLKLKSLKELPEGEIIRFEVLGDAGEKKIYEIMIDSNEFDEERECIKNIKYQIDDTPKVSYAITVLENAYVELIEITWQRIS